MFEPVFLGQARLTISLAQPRLGQFSDPCGTLERFIKQLAESIAYANKSAQQALARGDNEGVNHWTDQANKHSKEWEMWKKRYDDCLRANRVPAITSTPVTPEPEGYKLRPGYPVTYPWPGELFPPPVPTEDKPPYRPFSPRNIPEGAYSPTPTFTSEEQGQGLPCPEGQYRPQGSGWCVPKPVPTGYGGLRTVPYGSVFGGGFGGGQGVSAGSFM